MKKSMIIIALMLCSIDSAFCVERIANVHPYAAEGRLNFSPFSRLLRNISACPRGMLTAGSLNMLANSEKLTLDGEMMSRLGFRKILENSQDEEIKMHINVILSNIKTPSNQDLQSSLGVFHDWLTQLSRRSR